MPLLMVVSYIIKRGKARQRDKVDIEKGRDRFLSEGAGLLGVCCGIFG
jgi:hypothetical protein